MNRCASWMRGVAVVGTTSAASATYATLPPSPAGDADGERAALVRLLEPAHDVGARPRGRQPDGHVTGPAQRLELAGEDVVERAVVGDRGEQRAVGGQGEGGEAGPVDQVAADELGGEVLALGRAAAVAEPEHRAAGAQGLRSSGPRRAPSRARGPASAVMTSWWSSIACWMFTKLSRRALALCLRLATG